MPVDDDKRESRMDAESLTGAGKFVRAPVDVHRWLVYDTFRKAMWHLRQNL